MCDETTDVFDKIQMVIILRYELKGKAVERFWGFFNPVNQTAEALSCILCKELELLIKDHPHKLIAQSYDGAAALSGVNKGVQARVKELYGNAHFVHCYAHQLNLILEKATSQNSNVRVFFNSLSGIPAFFSNSPQRMAALDNTAGRRIPRPSTTRWNFKSRTVNTVYESKDALIACCSKLEASNSKETGSAAAGIKRMLNDSDFSFWLTFFSKVMPLVEIMFSQLQSRSVDECQAKSALKIFTSSIQELRDQCNSLISVEFEQKRRRIDTRKSDAAKEVCDVILLQCRERFSFTNHLEAAKLLLVQNFSVYANSFPSDALAQAVKAYPTLVADKLKTELTVLYKRRDLWISEKLTDMLHAMIDNNLQSTFSEVVKLLKILITTPMSTAEAERCFSTLKRIKTFLRSTMTNDRLSALGMITIENKMTTDTIDFNEQVINDFATSKSRRMDFVFK